jgi:hypothetical protein
VSGTSRAQINAVPSFAGSPESISTSEPSTTPPATHFGLPPLPNEGGDAIPLPERPPPPSPSSSHGNLEEKPPVPAPSPEPIPDLPATPPPQSPTPLPVTPPTAGVPSSPPRVPRCTGRVRKAPGDWWKLKQPNLAVRDPADDNEAAFFADNDFCEVEFAGAVSTTDPHTYRLAMQSPDREHWQDACNTEVFNLEANRTWELTELPPGKKVVNSGWVFKVKRLADGSIERYRACLVAKGFSQRPGYDYSEVFAPTFC